MKHGVLADVGPLFAAIDPTDQYHQRAIQELARLNRERRPVYVSYSTLVEGQGLILRRIGAVAAARWLAQILADAVLVAPDPDDYLTAAALLARFPDQRITLADAVVAVLGQRLEMSIWPYDHHFDVLQATIWR